MVAKMTAARPKGQDERIERLREALELIMELKAPDPALARRVAREALKADKEAT